MITPKATPLPKSILTTLNEHSRGGFFLFRIAADGEPEFSCHFDDSTHYLGLSSYAQKILRAMEVIDTEAVGREIIDEREGNDSGE